ncbi:hypothetical protein EYD45_15250 [Hyunsoonleella flava]|uniref:Uncharacterized protein n=1 Tax=Hyunsoonleella flava TaxID=2527939 RepID=A0A4Q9FBI4_9FLAO|nr:hypothetical protein [Hyunsoonleella flava]TBM99771.1 hypothetical protein EYD45_15250 [Hyunsoonleella flava]
MHKLKQHIAFRIFSIILAAALLVPAALKFAHVFEHHKHIVCKGDNSTHIHQVDLECEFYKFQLNHHFLLPIENDSWLDGSYQYRVSSLTYKFLYNHRQLSFSLRGPPVLV